MATRITFKIDVEIPNLAEQFIGVPGAPKRESSIELPTNLENWLAKFQEHAKKGGIALRFENSDEPETVLAGLVPSLGSELEIIYGHVLSFYLDKTALVDLRTAINYLIAVLEAESLPE